MQIDADVQTDMRNLWTRLVFMQLVLGGIRLHTLLAGVRYKHTDMHPGGRETTMHAQRAGQTAARGQTNVMPNNHHSKTATTPRSTVLWDSKSCRKM